MKKKVFLLLFPVVFLTGCLQDYIPIKGEGDIIERELSISNFNKINLTIYANVIISYGDQLKVKVVGHENIVQRLKTTVINKKWIIELQRGNYKDYQLTIYITLPEIKEIDVSGSGEITLQDFQFIPKLTFDISGSASLNLPGTMFIKNLTLKVPGSCDFYADTIYADEININIAGHGNFDLCVFAEEINTTIDGSIEIYLYGKAINQKYKVSGSGQYHSFGLESNKTKINIQGSARVEVYVLDKLWVDISGYGEVYYKGNPTIEVKITGSGDVYNSN